MGLLHRFLDHRTPDAWSRLESPLHDLKGVPIKQMAGIDRRRAGCLTSCSGVTKNRHWSIQTFSFSDAEVDAGWDMIYGYARVSTDAQDLAIQLELLRAAGCEKVFHDKEAGDSADRPQLKRLMKKLSAGDVVKAPATDRFARDPTDLLVLGRDIRAKGARLVSIAEPIVDTDSEFWELVAGAALSDGRLDCSGRVALEAERSDASSPGSEAVDQGDPRERRCGAHM